MSIIYRTESPGDILDISQLLKSTFDQPDEAELVESLRDSGNLTYALVAVDSQRDIVVGYAALSPVKAKSEKQEITGLGLAPLVVEKEYRSKGIGSSLINKLIDFSKQRNTPFISVLGEPEYYQKFGFERSIYSNIKCCYEVPEEFFLIKKNDNFAQPDSISIANYSYDFEILDHSAKYKPMIAQFECLIEGIDNIVSRMSTLAALLHNSVRRFSWTGFYLHENDELIVGPFQGPVACLKLQKDKGVCWSAVNRKDSVLVGNVHEFPGHIACDANSCSEVVIPCKDQNGKIYAVLDIDSYDFNAFNNDDISQLEKLTDLLTKDLN